MFLALEICQVVILLLLLSTLNFQPLFNGAKSVCKHYLLKQACSSLRSIPAFALSFILLPAKKKVSPTFTLKNVS